MVLQIFGDKCEPTLHFVDSYHDGIFPISNMYTTENKHKLLRAIIPPSMFLNITEHNTTDGFCSYHTENTTEVLINHSREK